MALDRLLIPTKFAPPRISPQATPRSALLARLREAHESRLVLVCGNAGFGKTTLLAQWRQELLRQGEHVAWLSLSADEQRLPQFRTYLIGALQQIGLVVEDGTTLPTEAQADLPVAGLVANIIEAVCQYGRNVHLFIDDYHHVEDASIHTLLQSLLDHGPESFHLAIASRTAPPLSISRMRLTGELTEIALPELPFTFEETQDFVAKSLGDVSVDDARLIHDIADGWPVCVQMICIRLKRSPANRAVLAQTLYRRADLQRYLSEDVVRHLAPAVVEFIEQVAVCRRFNADLARHVTGNPEAAAMLERIERDNLFVLPIDVDSPTPWYRFHPLFANFLQDRLRERDPQRERDLHLRASRWFGAQGLTIEALRHAYYADDFETAARLIESADAPVRSMSFIRTLQRWMDQLPADKLLAHPTVLMLGCWALVAACRWRDAQRWLERLDAEPGPLPGDCATHVRYLRASIALQRDDSETAMTLLATTDFDALDNRFLRQVHLADLSFAYCAAGRYDDARALHDRIARLPRAEILDDLALVAESTLLLGHLLEGNQQDAIRVGSALLARAEREHGRRSVSAVNCAAFLADACYEAGAIDDAQATLANRLDLLRFSSPEPMIRSMIVHGRLVAARVGLEQALSDLDSDKAHCIELALDRPLAHLIAEQARLLLTSNHIDRAIALQAELDRIAAHYRNAAGMLAEIDAIAAHAATRLAIAVDDYSTALALVERMREYGIRYVRRKYVALADVLKAVALSFAGRDSEAAQSLASGLAIARRFGLVRSIVDEGAKVRAFITSMQSSTALAADRDTLAVILDAGGRASGVDPSDRAASRHVPPEDALKPRELEILTLIGESMPNKQIALTLNITLDTVKWNLKNIFAKLDVSSRYEAVTTARKRGLIQ